MGVYQHGRYAALSHICKVKQFFRGGSGLIVGRLKIIYEVIKCPSALLVFFVRILKLLQPFLLLIRSLIDFKRDHLVRRPSSACKLTQAFAPRRTMARFNPFLSTLVLLFSAFLSLASAWDISNENDREGCQAYSQNPLEGCGQERTVFVDVVSPQSKFKTVQSGKTHPNRIPTCN